MKKDQFLIALRQELSQLPKSEIEDIIRDQNEYLSDAIAAGRTEESAVAALGSPKVFAQNLLVDIKIQRAESAPSFNKQVGHTLSAFFAILALAPLNIIFVLGPFLGLFALLIGFWAIAMGFFATSIAIFAGFFFKLIFVDAGFWTHLSTLFFSLGMIGASLIFFIFMFWMTNGFMTATLSYLKWNLSFIKTRSHT